MARDGSGPSGLQYFGGLACRSARATAFAALWHPVLKLPGLGLADQTVGY